MRRRGSWVPLSSWKRRAGSIRSEIAYTYSEPLVHAEYVLDATQKTREAGLKNVLVSNGYLNPGPAEELLGLVDAANIDLKAFDPEFYRTETGGKLEEVKRFITQAAAAHPPGGHDAGHPGEERHGRPDRGDRALHRLPRPRDTRFISPPIIRSIGTRFRQRPPATLRKLAEAARQHLRYVYMGNIGPEETITPVPACGAALVRRVGYSVKVTGIKAGACAVCGARAPIVMGD